jgi:flagellar biogenesis protein FliO
MGASADSYLGGLERLGYVLAGLAGLAAGVVWVWRKFAFGWNAGAVSRRLKIEESRMLGYKQHLVVAEYEGRKLLLGVCPGRIDFLCRLDEAGEDFERLMSKQGRAAEDVMPEPAVGKGNE